MDHNNIFQYVKKSVKLSDFVRTLPNVKGLHSIGGSKWRCNNVISGGSNTNSMSLDDDSGFFKMFSHGQEAGDIIDLYALTLGGGESSSKRDAVLGIAQHMSISIPTELLEKKSYSPRTILTSAMDEVSLLAHDYLLNSDDEDAATILRYLLDRGASISMIKEWRLGALPSHMQEAYDLLLHAGDKDSLKKIGLLGGRSGNFVAMAGRLVFPILNPQGKCVSLSSRVVPGVDTPLEDSKYINTSSTPIYDKSTTLYGSHLLRRGVSRVLVCEGNFDVIALNELTDDTTVAVATCGTALTEGHVSLLKKYSPHEVMIFFDSDDAGRRSAAQSLWLVNHIARSGIYAPSGEWKDPWDIYSSGGDVHVEYAEPMSFTAARIASQLYDRDSGMEWFKNSYKKLNFRDDREHLINAFSRFFDVKRKILDDLVSGVPSASVTRMTSADEILLTPAVVSIIRALLALDPHQRETVAFPLVAKKTTSRVMDMCGARTDLDRDAILTTMKMQDDDRLNSYVHSLCPEPETGEVYLKQASRNIAAVVMQEWKDKGIPDHMSPFIPAITVINSGRCRSTGVDQFDFIMDMAASSQIS